MTKRSLLVRLWILATVGLATVTAMWAFQANQRDDPSAAAPDGRIEGLTSVLGRRLPDDVPHLAFVDSTEQAGVRFEHFQAERSSMLPEDMGPGLAWGDYDDDGDPDLFLVNFSGSVLHGDPERGTALPALLRNDGGTFVDVTHALGLAHKTYGLGASWADYDGDGDLDLHLTCFGPNRLYRNDGDTFVEIGASAGVADDGFGAGAAWADYDRDGDLDLYVANYVVFDVPTGAAAEITTQYGQETPYTINPSSYPAAPNRLYRNDGHGHFEEVAAGAGVANADGRSLSAAWMDFDDDGWLDLYVANDVSDNGVFRNMGNGQFDNIGASSLAADYRGAMGLAVGDPDGDTDLDIFVTHWLAQENAFFENMSADEVTDRDGHKRLFFMDSADALGLGQATLQLVGWATAFTDLDSDGDLDLWLVNGHTLQKSSAPSQLVAQPAQIYQREDDGYYEVGQLAAGNAVRAIVGRGGAHADYDGDGRIDIAIAVHGDQPRLLRNVTPHAGHWIALDLRQPGANSRALGAKVTLSAGGNEQHQQSGVWGNYLSQSQSLVYFGIGTAQAADRVEVRWPTGDVTQFTHLESDRIHRLER